MNDWQFIAIMLGILGVAGYVSPAEDEKKFGFLAMVGAFIATFVALFLV